MRVFCAYICQASNGVLFFLVCTYIHTGWDQSDKFVKIYINGMDGIKIENIRSDFNQR